MKAWALRLLQVIVPVCLLGCLIWEMQSKSPDLFADLYARPKRLDLLAVAVLCTLAATCISFARWFVLVRALDIPFQLLQAFRLGFLGYLFNFVGPGAVGGDLFKAYFLAKDQQDRRAEAVATILLDRVVGMFALMIVATLAILATGVANLPDGGAMFSMVPWMTAGVALGFAVLLSHEACSRWLMEPLSRLPFVGGMVKRITAAIEMYRARRLRFVAAVGMGVLVHGLLACSIHFADRAVFPSTPQLNEHLVISPLAGAASALPIPGGGLGTYEAAMRFLFEHVPRSPTVVGQGFAVAIVYRFMTILIAGIGVLFYWANRRDVDQCVNQLNEQESESTA